MIAEYLKNNEGLKLSKSAYKIIEIIEKKESVSASELVSELNVSTRTIHYSLQNLLKNNILNRQPYLPDMRQTRYTLNQAINETLVRMRMNMI